MHLMTSFLNSWRTCDSSLNTLEDILTWIKARNENLKVSIVKNCLYDSNFWFYDEASGCIRNKNDSFFQIRGFKRLEEGIVRIEQPILIQDEIGYLGIICKEFGGVMHFLMQAKIEPGNINKIQISPTIQATRSNFTQRHGGAKPAYLEYFVHARDYLIVVDQIQSEQSLRFLGKRNRNIIIYVPDAEVEVLSSHCWMTLGQIKRLMRKPNLVNMDTRTVLSCIPFGDMPVAEGELVAAEELFLDKALFHSAFLGTQETFLLPDVYHYINDYKMFNTGKTTLCRLDELSGWHFTDSEFVCDSPAPFKIIFCDISIEGREVARWTQPLFEAQGTATFGLLMCEDKGVLKFVVRPQPEAGCFDMIELGPTVQTEAGMALPEDRISRLFFKLLATGRGVVFDNLLSEEGGRFYHEQNRNVLIRVEREIIGELPQDCFLLDYRTLNKLIQVNNTLNIQLRNLLALMEA